MLENEGSSVNQGQRCRQRVGATLESARELFFDINLGSNPELRRFSSEEHTEAIRIKVAKDPSTTRIVGGGG